MLKTDFIKTIQTFIADGKTDEALTLLRQETTANYPALLNDVTLIENRYQTAHDDFVIKGILSKEEYDNRIAKINLAILVLVNKTDYSTSTATVPVKVAPKNNGRLLHNIPEHMPLQKESRCIVRIAFDDDIIQLNLPASTDTIIQTIRISEVMSVALLDFNETPCFAIRTVTEGEQFIDAGDYTQWIFLVKPLKSGHYPLTLKVTVMEKIDGKERKRDIVLEKEIYIVTQVSDDANRNGNAQGFTDTNILITGSDTTKKSEKTYYDSTDAGMPAGSIKNIPTGKPSTGASAGNLSQTMPPPPAQTETLKIKSNFATLVTSVLALFFVAGIGFWFTTRSSVSSSQPPMATTSVDTAQKSKTDLPGATNKDSGQLAQTLPKDNNPAAPPPTSGANKPVKKPVPSDADVASNEIIRKKAPVRTTAVKKRPLPMNEPDILAMKNAKTPANENLPNIIYAQPIVIQNDKIAKTGVNVKVPMRMFLIRLINVSKFKNVEIFIDGKLVQPNLNANGESVSVNFISNVGPHTVILKKGNKTCEYPDVLLPDDTASIEGCNLD
jgi:hypothetical protein